MDTRKTNKLGEFVRNIRAEKKMSVNDVSKRSGGNISPSYINMIENQKVNPSAPKMKALAKGLGVTETEIFAIIRGLVVDVAAVASERFSRIADGYSLLTEQERKNIEPMLLVIETTIESSDAYRRQKMKNSSAITYDEAMEDDKKKNKKHEKK